MRRNSRSFRRGDEERRGGGRKGDEETRREETRGEETRKGEERKQEERKQEKRQGKEKRAKKRRGEETRREETKEMRRTCKRCSERPGPVCSPGSSCCGASALHINPLTSYLGLTRPIGPSWMNLRVAVCSPGVVGVCVAAPHVFFSSGGVKMEQRIHEEVTYF